VHLTGGLRRYFQIYFWLNFFLPPKHCPRLLTCQYPGKVRRGLHKSLGYIGIHWMGVMSVIVKIKLMCLGEETIISDLVTSTFQRDVAPLYAQEGIREFLSYANPSALKNRQAQNHVVLVASQDESIVGMLELRDYCHVSLLFVDAMQTNQNTSS
jgi:hypothetical protein